MIRSRKERLMRAPGSIAALALACGASASAVTQDLAAEEARRLLGAQCYAEALSASLHVSDPAERAFLEVQVRCEAGDFAGGLRAARRGVELAPAHLGMLYYASDLALSLGATELAEGPIRGLGAALVDSALTADVRGPWLASAERLERDLAAARAADEARARAARQARFVGMSGVGVALLATLLLLRR